LASGNGLPCSSVSSGAIVSTRWRNKSAALRMILERSKAETLRQARKPLSAASSARSRSLVSAWATVPIGSPVAGLTTGMVRPPAALAHCPSINSNTSEYMANLEGPGCEDGLLG